MSQLSGFYPSVGLPFLDTVVHSYWIDPGLVFSNAELAWLNRLSQIGVSLSMLKALQRGDLECHFVSFF